MPATGLYPRAVVTGAHGVVIGTDDRAEGAKPVAEGTGMGLAVVEEGMACPLSPVLG